MKEELRKLLSTQLVFRAGKVGLPLLLASIVSTALIRWYYESVLLNLARMIESPGLFKMYFELAATSLLHGVLIAVLPLFAASVLRIWLGWALLVGILLNYLLLIFGMQNDQVLFPVVIVSGVVLVLVAQRAMQVARARG
ncbi:hypothetical protein [uncultured Halopseudomonas sp.]|uniref:hypothetical protein n=1 Tax=uncultured Halopseudomonas sp. TaxID=2901193 RepID=UPI0030EF815B|tara:strand:+ start:18656 stop:19075 length:420 start_codon:yes stop_codon:yes gene_type:complete